MTEQVYFTDTYLYKLDTTVTSVSISEGKATVALKSTIFHPQGGGQPSDIGEILCEATGAKFIVEKATMRKEDSIVEHAGYFAPDCSQQQFQVGDAVVALVNERSRLLHARLHSAGHLLDLAVLNIGKNWSASKAYHFVDGPYVEYNCCEQLLAPESVAQFEQQLQSRLDDLVRKDDPVLIEYLEGDALKSKIGEIPSYLPKDKPIRIVTYGGVSCACSGTHVSKFSDLAGRIIIKKAKVDKKKNTVRVGYNLETGSSLQ